MNKFTALFIGLAFATVGLMPFAGCKSSQKTMTKSATTLVESWETISNRWRSVSFPRIKRTADGGDVSAQYYLGAAYLKGIGIEENPGEAFKWMKLAGNQGMVRAKRWVGLMLQNGLGTGTNVTEAAVWYQSSARQGDAEAQRLLGYLYLNGLGIEQDYAEALRLFRLSAEQGDAMAQNNLGYMYQKGLVTPRDPREALKWYQKSAEQGESRAQKNLAWMYASGSYGTNSASGQGAAAQIRSGGLAPNLEQAEKWMREAVDLNTATGQFEFGCLLINEFNDEGHQDKTKFPTAADYFRKAAEQGHNEAQLRLASMYHNGQLGANQTSECIPWFLKAAAQGNAEAQAVVGTLSRFYPNSDLLKSINAVEMLRQSAEKGNLDAQFELAKRYQAGDGVPKAPTEAFKWMQLAAQNKERSSLVNKALYRLGLMYETGYGVPQNASKARALYRQATFTGFPDNSASFRVARMYEIGEDLPQDDFQAIDHYYDATGGEFHSEAIENLFRLYADGRGYSQANQESIDSGLRPKLRNIPALIEYSEVPRV